MNLTKAWAAQMDDFVIDLAWSPAGGALAAASAAGPVSLFHGATGVKLHGLPGHVDGTNAIAFAPAGQMPEVSGHKAEVSGQRAEVGSQGAEVSGQKSEVGSHSPEASGLTSDVRPPASVLFATGGQDGKARFWDIATGLQSAEADAGRGAWVDHLQWRPASSSPVSGIRSPVLAASAGRKLLLLNPDGSLVHAFKDAPKSLSALAWHPRGGAVAAASFGSVVILDADDFRVQREYRYGSAIEKLVWSPDGRWLVAGAQDNAVHLWIPGEDQEFHMSGYETKVRELSFSSDSRWLATGGARDVCVWDCTGAGPEGREPIALPHAARVCAVAFQHSHGLLASAAQDCEVALWSLDKGETRVATVRLTAPASNLEWSPDDSLLAIGSQKGGVLVLRVEI
jgi:WD40 repeat protein